MAGHNSAARTVNGHTARRRRLVEPLARGLRILEAFRPDDHWLANKDIVRRVGLPATTASRLLRALTDLGYLAEAPRRRLYRLAAPVLALGYAAAANDRARQDILPHLQSLADSFNATVVLGERDRLDIQLVEVSHSIHAISPIDVERGARFPIAETVLGSALIYALRENERSYLLAHLKEQYPKRWSSIARKIATEVDGLRKHGFFASRGNQRSQLSMVATPFVSADSSSVCVLGCFSQAGLLPAVRIEREIGPTLVAIADYQSAVSSLRGKDHG